MPSHAYLLELDHLDRHLKRLWRGEDEDSALRMWKVLSDLCEIEPETSSAAVDDEAQKRRLRYLRLEFIQGNEKRGMRPQGISTVIAEDHVGPFLRLSSQALENSMFTVGTPVKIAPEYGVLKVRRSKG